MSLSKKKLLFITALCVLFLMSCTSGVLIKPQAQNVKTVALISVSANRIVNEALTSYNSSESEYFKSLKIDKKQERKSRRFVRSMVNYAASVFEKKLSGIKAWQVTPKNKIFLSKAYKKYSLKMKAHSKSLLKKQNLPPNLFRYNFRTANFSKRGKMVFVPNAGFTEVEKNLLGQMAKSLKVDAVAILDLDMAYAAEKDPNTFSAMAGVSVVMVDKNGEYVALTSPVKGGQDASSRWKSSKVISLPNGKMIYNKKTLAMFKDSAQASIAEIADTIKAELGGM